MKLAFPIVLTPAKNDFDGYAVTVPDLTIYTQGSDIAEVIAMARVLPTILFDACRLLGTRSLRTQCLLLLNCRYLCHF